MSIVRFLAAENDSDKIREDFLSACSLVLFSGATLSLLYFVFSGLLAKLIFQDSSLSSYIRLSSTLILLTSIFPVLTAFFRRGSKIGAYNFFTFGLSIIQIGLTILLLLLGYSLTGVIIANIIGTGILDIIAVFIILRQIGFQRPRFINMKAYLKWGIPLTPNSAILWIIHQSDRYIVSYFLGVSAAGIYSAAHGIGSFASFGLMPVGIVLYPIVSKTYDEGNRDQCSNYFKYSFKYLMMISIPAAAGLA
jgi:O-antigen/teichoic acid export membrane protein